MEEIVQLVERFSARGEKDKSEAAALLKRYAGGEMSLEAFAAPSWMRGADPDAREVHHVSQA